MTAQKPEFPKPQLIREDFLPEPTMKRNYRIQKVTLKNKSRYYPQKKFLWFWFDLYKIVPYTDGGFDSFEEAQKRLCDDLEKPKIEYFDVNCGETK